MPIHDWKKVPAGLFHDFHQTWSIHIKSALNSGLLPRGMSALVEQRAGQVEGDVLTIEAPKSRRSQGKDLGGLLTRERPLATIVSRSEQEIYADRANRVVVKHHLGRIVAVIEIVSPGNKGSRAAFRDFVDKSLAFLSKGIHLLIVDLFPPTPRDPFGIHKAIWDEFLEEPFEFPPGKDRIVASYEMGLERTAFVEPIGVGDELPNMALFLEPGLHIKVPLEATYQNTWNASPEDLRTAVETGVMPEIDAD